MLLCKRAIGAAIGLRRYQLSQQAKTNAKRIESNLERRTSNDEPSEPLNE